MNNPTSVLALPYISGGLAYVQWADCQTGPSTYDWTVLDSALAKNTGQVFNVAVRGNRKPVFLFGLVPYTANWGDDQVEDTQGILMYWHPAFASAYTNFLAALAAHLNNSPYRSSILAFRMNYDAIGNEHIDVPAAYQKAAVWTVPPGVTTGPDWTKAIIDAFASGFGITASSIHSAGRPPMILSQQATGQPAGFTYADYFQQGRLWLFHTSSEPEPRGGTIPAQYDAFLQYALTGLTVGQTEPWADAWGYYGSPTLDSRWSSPPQWNYWRLLSDLNMGISQITLYGDDMTVAQSAIHTGLAVGTDYQTEFDQAFRFAARYAGYHLDAAAAPGAWIAFRQSITNLSPSDYNTRVTDYRRFVTLLNPQDTVGLDARKDGAAVPVVANRTIAGEYSIGPYNSRFGIWARSIPAGHTAELQLDSAFANSVNSLTGALINLTYLDSVAGASFIATFGTQSVTTALTNSGTWKTVAIPVTSKLVADAKGGHIAITTAGGAVIFHMVEVAKPAITVLNGASWQPALAPGALFSIFGANLAAGTASAANLPLPTQLGGATVTLGGQPVPLIYVSPSQINAQIPYEISPGAANLVISNQPPVTVAVTASAPGVFAGADGQAIVQNQDYTINTAQNPAARNSVVTAYFTGLGAVSNPPATGAAASTTTLSQTTVPVTVWFYGTPATVLFAGLTPSYVGLAQVNFRVPNAKGTYPLVIQVGSNASHVAMLSTK